MKITKVMLETSFDNDREDSRQTEWIRSELAVINDYVVDNSNRPWRVTEILDTNTTEPDSDLTRVIRFMRVTHG
jgi:hypothetical protein